MGKATLYEHFVRSTPDPPTKFPMQGAAARPSGVLMHSEEPGCHRKWLDNLDCGVATRRA